MIGFSYPTQSGPYDFAIAQAAAIVRVTAQLANSPITEQHVEQVVAALLTDVRTELIRSLCRDLNVEAQ